MTIAIQMEQIKQLRAESGAGIMECRRALEQMEGQYDRALELLRENAMQAVRSREDRPAMSGLVELYRHGDGRIGVMVEINTETDFAARSEPFQAFAHEIALHIAAAAPLYVSDDEIPADVLAEEARKATERAQREGKPEKVVQRIVEGVLEKFKTGVVLLRQPYIRDDTLNVTELLNQVSARVGERVVIRRFQRWERGETETEE
jgi:elongation factor Ts